jgi:hypothetical protein
MAKIGALCGQAGFEDNRTAERRLAARVIALRHKGLAQPGRDARALSHSGLMFAASTKVAKMSSRTAVLSAGQRRWVVPYYLLGWIERLKRSMIRISMTRMKDAPGHTQSLAAP